MLRGARTVYPDPNESTLLTLPRSASTLRSLLAAPIEGAQKEAVESLHGDGAGKSLSAGTSADTFSEEEDEADYEAPSQSDVQPEEACAEQFESESRLQEAIQNSPLMASTQSVSNACSEVEVTPGVPTIPKRDMYLIRAGRLHLHMEYPARSIHKQQGRDVGDIILGWLEKVEAERVTSCKATTLVDAEQLFENTTYEVNNQGCLLVATLGDIVRIRIGSTSS